MATAPAFEIEHAASTTIAVLVAQNPAVVLVDQAKRDDLYSHIRREIDAFTPDTTTAKGRDAIKSFAFKITRTKTAVDAAGKKLNEDARAKIGVVDAARRDAREKLDAMAEEVRRPLTEWEAEEEDRIKRCQGVRADIAQLGSIGWDENSETIMGRITDLDQIAVCDADFREQTMAVREERERVRSVLSGAHAKAVAAEEAAAELERLRAETAERAAREEAERLERERIAREAREAEAAAQRAAEAARQAEERRIAAAAAEQERLAAAERAAADAARIAAETAARKEREAIERRHADELAAAQRERAEEEAARQAEADRIASEKAVAEADARREAEAQAKREANMKHRAKVVGEAKVAIMACGADEPTAKAIVLSIVGGSVPHTSIRF